MSDTPNFITIDRNTQVISFTNPDSSEVSTIDIGNWAERMKLRSEQELNRVEMPDDMLGIVAHFDRVVKEFGPKRSKAACVSAISCVLDITPETRGKIAKMYVCSLGLRLGGIFLEAQQDKFLVTVLNKVSEFWDDIMLDSLVQHYNGVTDDWIPHIDISQRTFGEVRCMGEFMLSMIIPALQSICKTTYEKPPNLQVHLQNMANCAARFRTLASIVSDSARRQVLMNLADCLVSALAPLTPH